jgi:hypothetical protein
MARKRSRKLLLKDALDIWSVYSEEIAYQHSGRSTMIGAEKVGHLAECRSFVDGAHRDIHDVLGELTDGERESIWPKMEAGERERFDREHREWLRGELQRLAARLKFFHEAKAALAAPSPALDAGLAEAAEEWGYFVANCSREEERALGLERGLL